jgi:hypothetical protein
MFGGRKSYPELLAVFSVGFLTAIPGFAYRAVEDENSFRIQKPDSSNGLVEKGFGDLDICSQQPKMDRQGVGKNSHCRQTSRISGNFFENVGRSVVLFVFLCLDISWILYADQIPAVEVGLEEVGFID